MKKLKILAVVLGFALSAFGSFAFRTTDDFFDTQGVKQGACSALINLDQSNCQTTNHGAQCTITVGFNTDPAYVISCSAALNQP